MSSLNIVSLNFGLILNASFIDAVVGSREIAA
jgi:hypothetical protein